MKNFFKYIILLIFIAASIHSLSSCNKKFLDKSVQGSLGEEVLATRAGTYGLLVGAYGALDGQEMGGEAWASAPDNWIYGSVSGGEAHKGSDATDQPPMNPIQKWAVDPSNYFMSSRWRSLYEGITRCNAVLRVGENAKDISAAEKKLFFGEARFLRGHFYFELKRIFNMVPWIDETTTDLKQPNDKDIWPNIEADFKFAVDNLDNSSPEIGRVNKWAAAAYLAKTYLYQKKFNEAKTLFTQVINEGVTSQGAKYSLMPKYEDNFDPEQKNNAESIFAVQMSANNGSGNIANGNQAWMLNFPYGEGSPFPCCGFYQPSFDLVNSFTTDANGLPHFDNYNTFEVKNDMGIKSDQPYTPDVTNPIDPRVDWTAGRRGIPYKDWAVYPGRSWVRDQDYAGPYAPKKNVFWKKNSDKYWDKNSWAPGSAINVHIIRYADLLLMAAEAEAQAGSLSKAQEYVNMVRNRAANPQGFVYKYIDNDKPELGFSTTPAANYLIKPYSPGYFASKEVALKAIYFERKLELAMEGHRFFDLSRWGIANKVLNDYFAYEGTKTPDVKGGKWTPGKNEYFPIALSDIDISKVGGQPTLKQNPGY